MTEIHRKVITYKSFKIPEGKVVCPHCGGAGMMSKYDEGWRSIVRSRELAALRTCWRCAGLGWVDEEK